jgi:hypothetical protein
MKALVLALPVLFLAHALRAAVVAEPFPPAAFTSFHVEWDKGNRATSVQLANGALSYKVMEGEKLVEIGNVHPTADDWFKFIQTLNAVKVYNWADKYSYPGPGDYWKVDAVMSDRRFFSSGSNEYPKEGDESQPQANPASGPSVPFQLFWNAVVQLVGKQGVAPTQCPGKSPAAPTTK